ncbi:hypothetical protein [Kitasatospora sp. NPDC047058]|uniref:hypothetical protein n=1 Tax=Kitasatospora sp. NPDC047058 TaxID=3155620 RepID=UPI0033D287CE
MLGSARRRDPPGHLVRLLRLLRLLRLVRLLRRDTPVRPATAKDAGPPFLA